jgi:hypothetical protein
MLRRRAYRGRCFDPMVEWSGRKREQTVAAERLRRLRLPTIVNSNFARREVWEF